LAVVLLLVLVQCWARRPAVPLQETTTIQTIDWQMMMMMMMNDEGDGSSGTTLGREMLGTL
jgi:hypothetical protein